MSIFRHHPNRRDVLKSIPVHNTIHIYIPNYNALRDLDQPRQLLM